MQKDHDLFACMRAHITPFLKSNSEGRKLLPLSDCLATCLSRSRVGEVIPDLTENGKALSSSTARDRKSMRMPTMHSNFVHDLPFK